jgi:DNA-binding GntR family transcriptional regulator
LVYQQAEVSVTPDNSLLRLQTYQAIREGILSERYRTDVPLSEQRLATELRVSRTPVREAIKQLEHEGLVSVVPLRGIFVREVTARDVVEIFQIREALECFALRVSSSDIPREKLRALDELFERYESAQEISPSEKDRLFEADTLLHSLIVAATGNERMIQVLEPVRTQMLRVRSLSWSTPARVVKACCEHRRVIQALLQEDGADAEEALRDHLRCGRDHLLRILIFSNLHSRRDSESGVLEEG